MIAGFFANAWGKIVALAGIVLAVLAGLAKVYGAGKTAERAKAQEQQLENVASRNTVDSVVGSSSPDSNRERLRRDYSGG